MLCECSLQANTQNVKKASAKTNCAFEAKEYDIVKPLQFD